MRIKIGIVVAVILMLWAFLAPAADGAGGDTSKYSDGKLTVEWTRTGDDCTGTITMGAQQFPATAHCIGDGITGTFVSDGNHFPFTGSLDADTLTLITGGKTFTLKNQSVPANPVSNNATSITDTPAGYTVVITNEVGRTLSTQKQGAGTVQAALESVFPDLTRVFGEKPVIGSSYQDAKNPNAGGATFSATLNGHPIKGIVSCKLIDKGASIAVVYAQADATKAQWDTLVDPPRQSTGPAVVSDLGIPLREYDFPDGTGSIGLADGWITNAQSILHNIVVVGPEHQKLDMAELISVQTEDSPIVQMMRQAQATARRTQAARAASGLRTAPIQPAPPMLIAPYAAPVDALKTLLPQLSRMSEFYHGPSIALQQIISAKDIPAKSPNGKAASIIYTYLRTAQGKSVLFRCEIEAETVPQPPGVGGWALGSNSLHAPDATFDRDKLIMSAMDKSVKANMDRAKQVNDAEIKALIAKNHQIVAEGQANLQAQRQEMQQYHDQEGAAYQASREAQLENFADHNQQWAANETQKQRANADVIEQIKGTRMIYDTQTGATGSANLNDVSGVVDSLNQAALDPNRFTQVPLHDYLYAPTPVPGR
jgi:hypothetical protein